MLMTKLVYLADDFKSDLRSLSFGIEVKTFACRKQRSDPETDSHSEGAERQCSQADTKRTVADQETQKDQHEAQGEQRNPQGQEEDRGQADCTSSYGKKLSKVRDCPSGGP